MLGLGDYESSDEEQHPSKETDIPETFQASKLQQDQPNGESNELAATSRPLGPAPGPHEPSPGSSPGEGGREEDQSEQAALSTPASPYTANRELIHSLTLPTVPNVAIPPSPPGSPRASTSTKFQRFLELKAQGTHFNSKLAASSQLKNPSLFQNLAQFAGIDEDNGQYLCALPDGLAPVPKGGFPRSAYWEQLNKAQQERWRRKEVDKATAKREGVEFVSGGSAQSSQSSTPYGSVPSRSAPKGSAAERVMAGLDREKSRSPHPAGDGAQYQRKSRFDDRHHARQSRTSRSRSPKRRNNR